MSHSRKPRFVRLAAAALACASAYALSGCSSVNAAEDGRLKVVATTPIIADLAQQIAGPDADVTSLIPKGANPHTYEPSLRRSRDLAYADVALTNHLLLEEQRTMKQVKATLPKDSLLVELSEESEQYGAQLLPVVENPVLDQLWLGSRVTGSSQKLGRDVDEVSLRLTKGDGPGRAMAYITETFGEMSPIFDSGDTGRKGIALPPRSHTHMSWAFSKPGVYHLTFAGFVKNKKISDEQTVTFVVGGDPSSDPAAKGKKVLDGGHADITLDLDASSVNVLAEDTGAAVKQRQLRDYRPNNVVIGVGPKAISEVPPEQSYRPLGQPGSSIYLLPQAVLGKHVHGDTDPHVWLDVTNAEAWSKKMREVFVAKDPAHAKAYRARTDALLRRLGKLDDEVRGQMQKVPQAHRELVTTHDSFGYFAKAYGLKVAGFAVPATGAEPSARERQRLRTAIKDLKVPAVFVGPAEGAPADTLRQVAAEEGVKVCTVRSDTLDSVVPTYEKLLRYNASHISACLAGQPEPK